MDKTASYEPDLPFDISTQDGAQVLQYLLEQCKMSMDDVRRYMRQKETEKILATHKYSIFQSPDGRWKTSLPDETKKRGTRLIAKTRYEDLVDEIVKFYSNAETSNKLTLRKLFPEWLEYKNMHTSASSYVKRIQNDWNKYYDSDKLVDVPIGKLTPLMLDEWAHTLIKENSLTKKQFYNLAVIIRQSLNYATRKYPNLLKENPFQKVKVDKKMFQPVVKPKSSTQVFTVEEEKALCKLALEKYYQRPKSIAGLAIAFNFNLGLRIGELVALRWDDIEDGYIHIQRQETKQYILSPEGKITKDGVAVVEHTKSQAGDRWIYLNQRARNILDIVKERNNKYGFHDEDYIFVNEFSNRLHAMRACLYLYDLCDELGIPRKGSHKIRKTFATQLVTSGMPINTARELLGHESEITTLRNYCFDRNGSRETEQLLDSI